MRTAVEVLQEIESLMIFESTYKDFLISNEAIFYPECVINVILNLDVINDSILKLRDEMGDIYQACFKAASEEVSKEMQLLIDGDVETSLKDFLEVNSSDDVQSIAGVELILLKNLKLNESIFVGASEILRIQ